jgi:predicted Zn finger-like uncharacterized protein
MNAPRVQVRCPSCRAEYEFPERLMGPEGARVACPACGTRFRVARLPVSAETIEPLVMERREPAIAEPPAVPGPTPVVAAAPAAADERADARNVAEWSLRSLDPERERIRRAAEAGRLFAEFGPALLDAFDRFASSSACRTYGPRACRETFARAVRDRLGVTLPLASDDAS